jgi:hypothetical protein
VSEIASPRTRGLTAALHLLALHAVAVAAPLYDVLRRNREFFVAYHVTPFDLLLFVALVSVGVPLAGLLLISLAGLAGWRWLRAVAVGLVALLLASLASQLAARAGLPLAAHVFAAGAAGVAGAVIYARSAVARTFLLYLSPAIVIVPLLLLGHPSMRLFVLPENPIEHRAAADGSDTPIVLVVFDQLPLSSLMAADGGIDATHYPGFAGLASASTWYRRATTVADLTGWALPPIVTGRFPRPGRLPVAEEHPENLFTFLGRSHRMEVIEPITALCPSSICETRRESRLSKSAGMLVDSAVVYAYIITPSSMTGALPPLTENWRGFIAAERWQQRWINERDADRRDAPNRFLASIEHTDPQPTLYFLHALLPHEPYMYLASGQRFTDRPRLYGLQANGRWVEDPWPVTQAYAAELLQVEYVDRYIARLLQRLREEGLYDRTLLIVTADHGTSFRPGLTFKGINQVTVRDTAPVPLFVKVPGQRAGAVSDRNVQTIDIMPLVADVLKTPLTWEAQGISPLREDVAPPEFKTVFYGAATQRLHITPEDLHAGGETVRRKIELLGGEQVGFRTPTIAPRRDLAGRTIEPDDVSDETALRVVIEQSREYLRIDPEGELIPAIVYGQVMDEDRRPVSAVLAVAVNGRIEATTRTYDTVPGSQGVWTALVDPRVFRKGSNALDVFIVRETGLTRAFSTSPPALASINLLSDEAESAWEVRLAGFHPLEGDARHRFRWTSGAARIEMTLPGDEHPRSVRVGLAPIARRSALRVSYNGCVIFDGAAPGGPWYKTLSLDACPESARSFDRARVEIDSPTFSVPGDPRTLGLPFETLRLSAEPWPLLPGTTPPRARVRIVEPEDASRQPLSPGTPVRVEVANLGSVALPSAAEAETERPVRLVASWRAAAGGEPLAEQAVDLPRILYPGERLQTWMRLDLPPAVQQSRAAQAELSLELTQAGGPVALAPPGPPRLRVKLR